jgi:transglutaminase-like putative cysteine protease
MILEIQHETYSAYSEPVRESTTEVRMEPVSNAEQSCHSFHLAIDPPTDPVRYQDGFGNRVHSFNLLPTHNHVRILAAGIVETFATPRLLNAVVDRYPLNLDKAHLDALGFLAMRGAVAHTALLEPLLAELKPKPDQPVGSWVLEVCHYINTHFEYAPYVTLAQSPIDDVLRKRKGVCQDFTHLVIAILRFYGIPARYVSGYIHRPGKESQSHAWCEAWLPETGWVGLDPTNDLAIDEHFIKVAIGRDFSDVPPNKGLYRGRAFEKISVRVETRQLERLPSLSWQEMLPPLSTPLTAIVSRQRVDEEDEDSQIQQQQQQ